MTPWSRPSLVLVVATLVGLGLPAFAETRRVAVLVGNNVGAPAEKPLRYAEEDATKMADVLSQLGDVHPDHLLLLKGSGRADLEAALAQSAKLIAAHRQNPGDRTVLIFYYSGHSNADALELGSDRVSYGELRKWLTDTGADVRVVVVDGCQSGALVQSKGGRRGPAFDIKLSDQLDANGEAMLTSSAADELALESREIHGSFFTHHLVSGLRGAADASGDGRITLAEAYQYAFDHTLAGTAMTGVRQHPGYDYRIAGKGELVLTEVTQPSAALELPAGFERALIVLVRRDQVLAEVTSDSARRLGVAPGEYAVRLWKGTQAYATRVQVAAGDARTIKWSDLQAVDSPVVAGKGHTDAPEAEGLTPEAQVEYQEKFLAVEDVLPVTKYSDPFVIYQGKYRKRLQEADFFRVVGRADLASSFDTRTAVRAGLALGGTAVAVAAIVVGVSTARCNIPLNDPRFADECAHNSRPAVILAGGGLVGLALVTAGLFVNPHPVEPEVMRRLADGYNVELRRKLSSTTPSVAGRSSGLTFEVAAYPAPGGGGLTIAGTF